MALSIQPLRWYAATSASKTPKQVTEDEARRDQRQRDRDRANQHIADRFAAGIGEPEVERGQLFQILRVTRQKWSVVTEFRANLGDLLRRRVLAEHLERHVRSEVHHQHEADEGDAEYQRDATDEFAYREFENVHAQLPPSAISTKRR